MSKFIFDPQIARDFVVVSPDGLCAFDRDLTYVAWNEALEKISGVPASEAVGKKVFELFPFLEPLGEREIHKRVFGGETVFTEPRPYNVPDRHRTGYFQGLYTPWRNAADEVVGIFAMIRDIGPSFNRLLFLSELSSSLSKAKTMQETLDLTLELLVRSTTANRGVVALITEDRKEIVAEALYGISGAVQPGERLGIEVDIPLTLAARTGKPVLVSNEAEGKRYFKRLSEYVEKTGDIASASVPMIIEGETIGSLALTYADETFFTEDDTNYLIAAANLCAQSYARARQFQREQASRTAAETANRAKSRFLANVSHELRTPLTVIIGHAELMKNLIRKSLTLLPKDVGAKMLKYSEGCFEYGSTLANILEDILDLAKIETGKITIQQQPVEIRVWLEELADAASHLASNKPIETIVKVHSEAPRFLNTDPLRAKQIILNLLSNAAKFTEAGSITIQARNLTTENMQFGILFTVEDTGIGIDATRQTEIFEAFEKTKSRERSGHGLGLAIANQLAVALGGFLRLARSERMKGSAFELFLPDLGELPSENALRKQLDQIDHITYRTLKGLKVLIAEDDKEILFYLSELLSSAGAEVISASDGDEAIAKAKAQRPDVVVLDIQMPILNGFEAASSLRKEFPDLPIIALTAHGLSEYKEMAQKSGFNLFLVKPIHLDTLAAGILSEIKKGGSKPSL